MEQKIISHLVRQGLRPTSNVSHCDIDVKIATMRELIHLQPFPCFKVPSEI